MGELFDEQEMQSMSPQGEWMLNHCINAFQVDEPESDHYMDWIAYQGDSGPNNGTNTYGHTKEQALLKLARKLKLTFYDTRIE